MIAKASKPKRVGLYLRVSTSEQTTRNQRRELREVAERHGWEVVTVLEDAGISGSKGRDERPGFDALMKAVARREIDMVAAWSVDRLGRSFMDLLAFLKELHAKSVDLFLHQQGLDTSTPSGRAMFQMLGVFAEFERAMIRETVMAGLARARSEGKQLGRRPVEQAKAGKVKAALALRSQGLGIRRIAREVGLGVGTVLRLVDASDRHQARLTTPSTAVGAAHGTSARQRAGSEQFAKARVASARDSRDTRQSVLRCGQLSRVFPKRGPGNERAPGGFASWADFQKLE